MAGYLDTYGAGEERRSRLIWLLLRWGGAALALALILLSVFMLVIPNRGEQKIAGHFFELLAARDYKSAYALWGCTGQRPCRDYPFDAFMRDWSAEALPVSDFQVLDGETCGSGVIVDVAIGKSDGRKLWVERRTKTLGFLPPGMERCPRGNRIYDFVRDIRYKMHGRTFK